MENSWRRWWHDRRGSCPRGNTAVRLVLASDGRSVLPTEREAEGRCCSAYPALIADPLRPLASDADPDDMSGRVEKILGELHKLLVAHFFDQLVHRHGVDELPVLDRGAVLHGDELLLGVHLGDFARLPEPLLLLGESLGYGDPDAAQTIAGREAERGVRAPASGHLVQDDGGGRRRRGGRGRARAEPRAGRRE